MKTREELLADFFDALCRVASHEMAQPRLFVDAATIGSSKRVVACAQCSCDVPDPVAEARFQHTLCMLCGAEVNTTVPREVPIYVIFRTAYPGPAQAVVWESPLYGQDEAIAAAHYYHRTRGSLNFLPVRKDSARYRALLATTL